MGHIINHTRFGFCLWDILAIIVLLGVVGFFVYKNRMMKEEEKELTEALERYET